MWRRDLRPLLILNQLIKISFSARIFSIILSSFLLLTFQYRAYALEEGGGRVETEYRSVNRENSTYEAKQYEMNTHLDAWQDLPNAGTLILWLDWINGRNGWNDESINNMGKGYLALTDFRYGSFIVNGLAGDSTLNFQNLPQRFSNSVYPDLYFRGFQSDLLYKSGSTEVFMGNVARLEGLLGKTHDVTDEDFYGFKSNFMPIQRLFVEIGFIRTQDEVDYGDQPLTKNNNILMFDSSLEIYKWMDWLIEFRRSDFEGAPGIESQSDYLLRLGPMIEIDKFRIESNYRRIGTDYHFVNQSTQGEIDQEGIFILTEYRHSKDLALFGNLDRYHNNVSDYSDRNTTDTTRGLIGLSYFNTKYPSFSLSFGIADRKNNPDLPSPVDNITSTLISSVRYKYKNFKPYLRYRLAGHDNEIHPGYGYNQNDITLGVRKNFKRATMVYVESELDNKKYEDGAEEKDLYGKTGFNHDITVSLSYWGEFIFGKFKDREEYTRRNKAEIALGLKAQLPWDLQAYGDIRYIRTSGSHNENLKSKGTQASLKFVKDFTWGERKKIAGLRSGIETKGYGTIEGFVFNDINQNGVKEIGEKSIKGITIRLEDGSEVQTDENGYYVFSRVEIGRRQVTLEGRRIPADYNIISPDKVRVEVKLRKTTRLNFQLLAGGRTEGIVINDANGNGEIDPGETGISDVLIFLEPGDNVNTFTDGEGEYTFENIMAGSYTLKLDPTTLPEGAVYTSPEELTIEVPVGGEVKGMNFLIHVKPRTIIMGAPKELEKQELTQVIN